MNVAKVVAALKQTDQLTCGALVNDGGGRCAIGQLFYAIGKTDEEIKEEEETMGWYQAMFDGLLKREYDMDEADVDAVWTVNDSGVRRNSEEENCQRRDRMVLWVQNYGVIS